MVLFLCCAGSLGPYRDVGGVPAGIQAWMGDVGGGRHLRRRYRVSAPYLGGDEMIGLYDHNNVSVASRNFSCNDGF